ncbi:hypothetical protein [Xanthobacter aminoxidans]|uniref:hypothetical protein n=1 Tax=Xanthobacter aminoxidans TaxID=186280 RepID=UPI002022F407|nr:hypothetical protein [Xanthobacter aminoxidans]MCL8385564.1 hypothetical protein [Xanthobacter aminoxidans]
MARAINLQTAAAVIANGASQSDVINVAPLVPVGIILPALWTTAALTFLVSVDGTTFYPLQDMSGEVSVTVGAGQYAALDPAIFIGIISMKLRSGTAALPVNQGADRAFTLVSKV